MNIALLSFAVALASMVTYRIAGGGADHDAQRKDAHFMLGLGDFLMHWCLWLLAPVERLALRAGVTPDQLNFAGLAFGVAGGLLAATDRLPGAGVALLLSGACDLLDGRIARATGVVSAYGCFIDSTLDRFAEAAMLVGCAVYLRALPFGPVSATAALAASMQVSYVRARGESLGVTCRGGVMQRAERIVLLALACLLDASLSARMGRAPGTLLALALTVIALAGLGTAVHRTVWISLRLRRPPTDVGR